MGDCCVRVEDVLLPRAWDVGIFLFTARAAVSDEWRVKDAT
jgi:hypothetical protein